MKMTDFLLEELSLDHEKAFLRSACAGLKDSVILDGEIKDAGQFRKFAKESAKQRLDWRPGPKKISVTRYFLFNPRGEICALGLMRFPLEEKLETTGGNLLFEVPPALRGQGYGSMCLALLLFEAVRAGLRRVLVTCSAENTAARRVFEKNRGQLEGTNDPKIARYWIDFSH